MEGRYVAHNNSVIYEVYELIRSAQNHLEKLDCCKC